MTELLFGLSVLLLLATLGCFIVGLIHPRAFTKLFGGHATRKHIAVACIPALVIATLFVGAFAPPPENAIVETRTDKQPVTNQQQSLTQQSEAEQETLRQQQAAEAEKTAQEKLEREQAAQATQEASALQQQQNTAPPPPPAAPQPANIVKKSRTDICHAPGTTYYSRTIHYTAYDTLEACLNSGGRLPKR